MRLRTIATTGIALAAIISTASPALAATSSSTTAAAKALKTQKCDKSHNVWVCITYRKKGNAGAKTNQFVASVKNWTKSTYSARLTVTNQKTWHNDKYPTVKPDQYVEVTKKTTKNGHACAALYVPPGALAPAWMACIN